MDNKTVLEAIAEIEKKNAALKEDMQPIYQEIRTLKDEMYSRINPIKEEMFGKINPLEARISEIQSEIDNNRNRIMEIKASWFDANINQ